MKKIVSLIMSVVLFMSSFSGLVQAQTNDSLNDWLSSLAWWFGDFGYLGINITVDDISSTSITFESPVILDEDDEDILEYVLWYGPHPFSSLLDSNSNASTNDFQSKEYIFTSHGSSTFTFSLSTSDGVDPNTLYYATVVPIAKNGDSGEMSWPDICFKLSTQEHDVGKAKCADLAWNDNQHSSAGANMKLANIDNTCNNNDRITLSWTAVWWATKVAIYRVRNDSRPAKLITTKNMSAEWHTFTLTNPSPPNVLRFIPLDANDRPSGTEVDYTLKLCPPSSGVSTPPTTTPTPPSIGKVPVVGPEQDIAYVILATLLLYWVFRLVRYRKNS